MSATSDTPANFDVFDCHHHVGDVKEFMGVNFGAATAPDADQAEDSERARRMAIMDEGGVRHAAVIPGHGYERTEGLADNRRINDRIAAYRDAVPERFPVAIGIVEPLYGSLALDELERCHDELGLAGISFHARFQGISMDNALVRRSCERMGELGMVPVLHCLTESSDEALWKVAQLARDLPDLTMLVLDAFSTFEGTKEISFVADVCPNLLFDTSLSYNFDFAEVFAQRFGADRLVFGTDLYSPPLGRRISHLMPQILSSTLSEQDKALVLGGNARRLYKLPG